MLNERCSITERTLSFTALTRLPLSTLYLSSLYLSETEFPPSIPDSSCQTRKIIFLTRNKPITLESLSIIINRPSDDAIFCRIRHTTVIEADCQLSACLYLGRQIQPGQWRIVIVVFDSPQKLESFQVIGRINSRVFSHGGMICGVPLTDMTWHSLALCFVRKRCHSK